MVDQKPVGGVEAVVLYPADAVKHALFSQWGCEVEFQGEGVAVALIDDASLYEEVVKSAKGIVGVTHSLTLVARYKDAGVWLATPFLERLAQEGVIATVALSDGRSIVVGYSQHFGEEQPLMLESVTTSSGRALAETPSVTLRLVSHDTALAAEII